MTTLHLVPHTHWDREWYLPFQPFRIKLVHLMDLLLDILERDPAFSHFTLDGQTIVLEDYLTIRPERESDLIRHIRSGRVLIGPWYILPDEFLVSPEATVRNLLRGKQVCARFGPRMQVGYTPDPFGHIGQMPQILRGFGIETAAFRRGLDDEPCEVWWEAPDGSRVLTSYLRDGYDNAARVPTSPAAFGQFIAERRDSLLSHSAVSHLLLLNGTDHQEPQPEIAGLVAAARLGDDTIVLSTLSGYFAQVRAEIDRMGTELPIVRGEARSPKRHHLLPGVLSSRGWIKQRNHACETLLERWAEPFTAWSEAASPQAEDRSVWTGHLTTPRVRHPASLLREAWRLLMECHPHDSICGCSVDAVHDEMRSRFDQVEQIGEEITRQSLATLAESVDTVTGAPAAARSALVVFNPEGLARSDLALAALDLPAGLDPFEIIDAQGRRVAYRLVERRARPLADLELDADGLSGMRALVENGFALGLAVQEVAVVRRPDHTLVDVALAEAGEPDLDALDRGLKEADRILKEGKEKRFRLVAHLATEVRIEALVPEVAGHGFHTLYLRPATTAPAPPVGDGGRSIENDTLRLEIADDGTLTLTDRRTGSDFGGLLRLSDVADRGDSYTFCPLEGDQAIEAPSAASPVRRLGYDVGQTLEVHQVYRLPRRLSPDRMSRSADFVELPVTAQLTLRPGVPRLDVAITLDNRAEDHRLQALFPLPFPVVEAAYDGAFEIVRRSTHVPSGGEDWIEQPTAEVPVRNFVCAGDGTRGLLVASQGLREAGVSPEGVIALTLLRCFGWLSRDDLATRRGAAGPTVQTPQGQELGPHTFHLSLIPFASDPAPAIAQALAFQSPLRAVGTPLHTGTLPPAASFLRWPAGGLHLSSVKLAEDGQDVIVRGVNLTDRTLEVTIEVLLPVHAAWQARLDETPLEALAPDVSGRIRLQARPHEILTLRLRLGPPATRSAPLRSRQIHRSAGAQWLLQ